MKIGIFTNLFRELSLDEALKLYAKLGITDVEIGAGGNPGNDHCDSKKLLSDEGALGEWVATLKKYNMNLTALSVHGNPVSPDKEEAKRDHEDFVNAVLLAEKLGVKTVVTFSGCPAGTPDGTVPNWVTCSWPTVYADILDYQWNEVLIPYWREACAFAAEHGVRVALEMHPGFCVYNAETLLRLRAAVGDNLGANLDPSHLIWQGCDPVAVVRALGPAIFHFHAKDTEIFEYNMAKNGALETKGYDVAPERSWMFRTVGYGHGEEYWRKIVSALRLVGYNGTISIEHEDVLMSKYEGLSRAVSVLKSAVIEEDAPDSFAWMA